MLRFGHEIKLCFAVADASQSHAGCVWQARWPQDVANMRKKLKGLSFSRVSEGTLGTFLGFLCYFLGTKLGCALLLRKRHKAMQLVPGRLAGHKMWANMRKKLKSLSFSRVSEGTLGTFLWFLSLCFGHEIRLCFAVADASQSHAGCVWQARWPQDVANMRKKLKGLSFSRVSEGTLGTFLGFLCYFLGTKSGCALLLRKRHKAMQLVLGRLAGHKMWANMRKKLKSLSFSRVSEGTLGTFLWFLSLCFGHEIRLWFAVADASQSHAAWAAKCGKHV